MTCNFVYRFQHSCRYSGGGKKGGMSSSGSARDFSGSVLFIEQSLSSRSRLLFVGYPELYATDLLCHRGCVFERRTRKHRRRRREWRLEWCSRGATLPVPLHVRRARRAGALVRLALPTGHRPRALRGPGQRRGTFGPLLSHSMILY